MVWGCSKHRFFTLEQKALSIINNLAGRSRHGPRHSSVSVNAIASQLVRNWKYEGIDRESTRRICQVVSNRWRASTPSLVNLSGDFCLDNLLPLSNSYKSGKARSGPWFYLSGPYNSCRSYFEVLGLWFPFSLIEPNQNSQWLEKSSCSCDSKAE